MIVSPKGLAEIASHEAIVVDPYKDSVGVWTIGIGHTASAGVPDPQKIKHSLAIWEVMSIFKRDIEKFEDRVREAFHKVDLKQHEFDAAVSFDFNTGAIHRATWVKLFNDGRRAAARASFMNWSKPPEIVHRRRKERDLFFNGRYSNIGLVSVYHADKNGRVLWSEGKRVRFNN